MPKQAPLTRKIPEKRIAKAVLSGTQGRLSLEHKAPNSQLLWATDLLTEALPEASSPSSSLSYAKANSQGQVDRGSQRRSAQASMVSGFWQHCLPRLSWLSPPNNCMRLRATAGQDLISCTDPSLVLHRPHLVCKKLHIILSFYKHRKAQGLCQSKLPGPLGHAGASSPGPCRSKLPSPGRSQPSSTRLQIVSSSGLPIY